MGDQRTTPDTDPLMRTAETVGTILGNATRLAAETAQGAASLAEGAANAVAQAGDTLTEGARAAAGAPSVSVSPA